MCFSPQQRAIFRHQNFKICSENLNFLAFWLQNVLVATAACNFAPSELQKSGPELTCFVHFHLKMLLATAACNFRHRNFKNCSENLNLLAFWLQNVLVATAAYNFAPSELQKSGPELMCFVHFHLKMCFSPQRRAIFDFSSDHMTPHPPL